MLREAILYIGLAQSLFAAFVLATKKRVSVADKILIMTLLTIALKFLILVFHNEHSEFFDLDFSMALIPLTFGPYLYLYTVYLVEGRSSFSRMHLLHFVPFVLVTVAYFAFFKDEISFEEATYFQNDGYLPFRIIYGLGFFSSVLIYSVLTFVKLRDFRRQMRSEFSYLSSRIQLYWLNFIALLFILIFLTYFVSGVVNALTFTNRFDVIVMSHVGLTILAYSVSYFGLRQQMLFPRELEVVAEARTAQSEKKVAPKADVKARFSDEEAGLLLKRLDRQMTEEKNYLNSELTLNDLSTRINLSRYELTDLLNQHLGKNFFTYVNEFRLEAVIRKLEDPAFAHLTIISLAYDCGFNSKSTFNSLFKQHTGLTPSEYKKSKAGSPS